ncbi:GNAT family N-acetyltransferase [Candidatus Poribacteria bacterium]|nr:GNAT family N-acetyltransferase [Candidatus Poribacteria bacterium]
MKLLPQIELDRLKVRELGRWDDLHGRRQDVDILRVPTPLNVFYEVGFAVSPRSIERALRLRYEVFNKELGEGLMASHVTGLDLDPFDGQMAHLVLYHRSTHSIVGTYRLQTVEHALATGGLYSAQEYDFDGHEPEFAHAVECGRACIARDHRSLPALMLLWRGISAFLHLYEREWLFGCCSLTTSDADDGWRAMKTLRAEKNLHESLFLRAREHGSCGDASREFDPAIGGAIKLPKLFRAYLRLGAKVVSEPCLDRAFGTVDFLILMDASGTTIQAAMADLLAAGITGAGGS